MLMLALPFAWVNHLVTAPAAAVQSTSVTLVGLVALVAVVVVGWALRRIRPVFVLVADLFRLVMVTAVTLAVIVGAFVFIVVTAVTR